MNDHDPKAKVATRDPSAPADFATPTLSAITPYRSAGQGGGADRTHIQEEGEQGARRAWGVGSMVAAIGAFASIPFALQESTFTAAMAATIGAGFTWLSAMTLRMYARERGASVALHAQHVSVRAAGVTRDIPWDSIVSVRADYRADEDRSLRAVALVSLTLSDRSTVLVPRAISAAGSLAHEVLARTKPSMVQRTRAALDQGLDVPLGEVILTPMGIVAGNHLWSWAARPAALIDGPFLHVRARFDPMPPSTILIENIENLHVVLDFIAAGYTPAPRDVPAAPASDEPTDGKAAEPTAADAPATPTEEPHTP